jgi:hypothetical protein
LYIGQKVARPRCIRSSTEIPARPYISTAATDAPAEVVETLKAQLPLSTSRSTYVLSRLRANVPAFIEMVERTILDQ